MGEDISTKLAGMVVSSKGNNYLISATKVGSKARIINSPTSDGVLVTWTEKSLVATAKTWEGGKVTKNHGPESYGKIISSDFDGSTVVMEVEVNDELAKEIEEHKDDDNFGVSIEASQVLYSPENFEIDSALGTGVTFVFAPAFPQCSKEEGCGLLATKESEVDTMAENEEIMRLKAEVEAKGAEIVASKEMLTKMEADLAKYKAIAEKYVAEEKAQVFTVLATKIGAEMAEKYKDSTICEMKRALDLANAVEATVKADGNGKGDNALATGERKAEAKELSPAEKEFEANKAEYEAYLGKIVE